MITVPATSRLLANSFFATDPTLFSSASLHSFSGPAWLRIGPTTYSMPELDNPVRRLELDVEHLGALSQSSLSRLPLPLLPGTLAAPKVEQAPFLRVELPVVRTQSVARLTGSLAARASEPPSGLHRWPAPADLAMPMVSNSVVEMAIDPDGEVVAARVLTRSGVEAADAEALRTARAMHFLPLASRAPAMEWGSLIIDWQTALPPDTNTPAAKQP
jgi:TonB family protein